MACDWRLTVDDEATAADLVAIIDGLAAFNNEHAPVAQPFRSLLIRANTADAALAGGLNASTYRQWLQVHHLWVHADYRREGLGRALLTRAEAEAKQRGCIAAAVDTFSFQARGFYERLGYSVFGTLTDCPPGHSRHFLQKRFA